MAQNQPGERLTVKIQLLKSINGIVVVGQMHSPKKGSQLLREELSQVLTALKEHNLEKGLDLNGTRHHVTTRSSCKNGKGNYGINSFNFLAFTLMVFNVVANVNNNLNNNNLNKNDNNINAISQNSNNVATNTNVANQIGVTVGRTVVLSCFPFKLIAYSSGFAYSRETVSSYSC